MFNADISEFNSLTTLLKGLYMPTEVGLFTGARRQFWQDALPATTSDRCGYQQELSPFQACWAQRSTVLTNEPW